MKLHLGCGPDIRDGYVNVDIQEPSDLKHDFRMALPYEDNTADEIYSRDVIQHFDRKEWEFIKSDWARVLKPGAQMNILCHDFEEALRNFLDNPNDPYRMQVIYAGQENEFDYFKNGFTYNKLVSDLSEEGMTNFERIPNPTFLHIKCQKS